ncbi:Mating-type switching protein swi10 [Wickerhamiella sorbophila]|uniref:Mating-type switching protein swi10 n=1 Tax=Wickerhamiella sorbophila TaxID=45607 RepID=A0A2T0FM04_9ASCO|nr:Mating-type switching protein swi10 [Wickerhamiella sorbophila]PRT56018.1 Mating-type switching protein swi10 [Wickerhamiella sorbophila]
MNRPVGKAALIINGKRQRKNPLLAHLKHIECVYEDDIKADFVTGATSCVLFLSMSYHQVMGQYIYKRMAKLGRDFELRILLVQVDVENPTESLKELTKLAIHNDYALIVAWSAAEAADYLREFKRKERSTGESLKGSTKSDYKDQLAQVLGKVRGINRTNALSLSTNYGSFRQIVRGAASVDRMEGFGDLKSERFKKVLSEPFAVSKPFSSTTTTNPPPAAPN